MSIGSFTDPIVVDPDPSLLAALAAAYRDAAPEAVNPDLDALRDAARGDEAPLSPAADLPRLTVLARDHVVDAITDPFYSASQLAALTEAGVWDLRTLAAPQPNAVLAGRSDGCVVIAASSGRDGDGASESPPIADRGAGSAPIRRSATATSISSRTRRRCESERRAAIGCTARRDRCGSEVADETVRLLTPATILSTAARARVRAYAAGARRAALDRDLRRACEDAGLGSSATFTRIKRDLVEAGLLGTESVSQPVGRPRQRRRRTGALADASSPAAALAALRKKGL